MSSVDKPPSTKKAGVKTLDSDSGQVTAADPLKHATEQLVHQLAKTNERPDASDADEPQDLSSLAIAGMAMTSLVSTTPPSSPLGQTGMTEAASPAMENLRLRAEAAERQVYEFQHYVQQVLQQLSYMTRRAETAEHYARQMHFRAENAEKLLNQVHKDSPAIQESLEEFRPDQRTTDWVQSKLEETQSQSAEFSELYLQSLELMSKGQHKTAVEHLSKLVHEFPKTVSYRTALHLAEGFLLQQQGMNPELTRRFERAMLIENYDGKPRPPVPTKK